MAVVAEVAVAATVVAEVVVAAAAVAVLAVNARAVAAAAAAADSRVEFRFELMAFVALWGDE